MKTMGHFSKIGRAELDSHADTSCACATAAIIEYTGKTCDVSPFSKEYSAMQNILLRQNGKLFAVPKLDESKWDSI